MPSAFTDIPTNIVSTISQDDLAQLSAALERWGFATITIHGDTMTDRASLFAEFARSVPFSTVPAVPKWASLSDELWYRLASGNDERVAFVWLHAEQPQAQITDDFNTTVEILSELAQQVASLESDTGEPRSVTVRVFLVHAS